MKTCSLVLFILCLGFSNLFSQAAGGNKVAGFYVLQDYDYFKTMLADIRRPAFHMRFYCEEPVKFTHQAAPGKHAYWDVAYGGMFPLAGYNFGGAAQKTSGVAAFIEASAHMLLDFDTPSFDVINTDFRIGVGVASRLPGALDNIALRLKGFHESTHIGDEFILRAMADPAFRRYNVSYEALEFLAAFDWYVEPPKKFFNFNCLRLYGGGRYLNKTAFEEFFGLAQSLRTKSKDEWQTGGEFFFKLSSSSNQGIIRVGDLLKQIITPQHLVLAADFYYRDRYAVLTPEKQWSMNLALGLVYGNYFERGSTTKLLVNYYNGVNPHGQFRMHQSRYLGVDFNVDF